MNTVVNLQPLVTLALQFVGAIALGLSAYAAKWLVTKLKLSADSEVRDYLTDALTFAVNYGMSKLNVTASSLTQVDVKNQVIQEAFSYLTTHVPDALTYFNLTPSSVTQKIIARLPSPDAITPLVAVTQAPAPTAPASN